MSRNQESARATDITRRFTPISLKTLFFEYHSVEIVRWRVLSPRIRLLFDRLGFDSPWLRLPEDPRLRGNRINHGGLRTGLWAKVLGAISGLQSIPTVLVFIVN